MELIPAVDLRRGKCVRLYQGDYDKETVFSADPVAMARHWQEQGARRLHVVDLDGAAAGGLCNTPTIREILQSVELRVQVGGGVRQLDTMAELLALGAERVILGTIAIEQPPLVARACRRFGEGIVVSIDAREGYVKSHGWRQGSATPASELAAEMARLGVKRFIYTDISRDGTLSGPNFEAIAELVSQTGLPVIAAGGISSLDHLERLAGLGVEGAIIGMALYSGDIDLKQALQAIHS